MRRCLLLVAIVALAGCATQPRVVPVASAPPAPAPVAAPSPGYGNLVTPPRLADGSYVTPNRTVSAAGAVWHLRAGLNVAALSCRGSQEAAMIAGYNALLQRYRTAFDQAYQGLSREHGNAAAFDGAMTRLYNYYALPPAQPGLCAAAQSVLADAALLTGNDLTSFAPGALARLERAYTTVFAAQDAWQATRFAPAPTGTVLVAAAAPTAPAPLAPAPPKPVVAVAQSTPQLEVDPAVLRMP